MLLGAVLAGEKPVVRLAKFSSHIFLTLSVCKLTCKAVAPNLRIFELFLLDFFFIVDPAFGILRHPGNPGISLKTTGLQVIQEKSGTGIEAPSL
ncbi:MAG: hypothetical protein KC505_02245 [Myxococcales bacterium]|nr:hypothetical protein [Myxococcales bacterium]